MYKHVRVFDQTGTIDRLKICSLNTRGIANDLKHRKIFRFVKVESPDVVFLQETHSVKDKMHIWTKEWGNSCYYSHGNPNARGVAILCIMTDHSMITLEIDI